MKYTIKVLKRAERGLAAIAAVDRERLFRAIDTLASNPLPAASKPLKGPLAGHHRLRVGDYRVIYQIVKSELVVVVVQVGHRRDVYR